MGNMAISKLLVGSDTFTSAPDAFDFKVLEAAHIKGALKIGNFNEKGNPEAQLDINVDDHRTYPSLLVRKVTLLDHETQLTILNNGSVGIGMPDPTAKFQVAGGAIMPAVGNDESAGIMFPHDPFGGTGDAAWIRYHNNRGGEKGTLEIGIANDSDDHIALMPSGNVGIGTTDPQRTLQVKGNGPVLALEGSDHAYIEYYPDSFANNRKAWLGFGGADNNNLTICNEIVGADVLLQPTNGNVGIGTPDPKTKLEIRDANCLIQFGPSIPALVKGTGNGGAIYFGVDSKDAVGASAPDAPTAAIETSWGDGEVLMPQIAIGVTRDFPTKATANLLMDYGGNTYIRQGTTPRLYIQGDTEMQAATGNVGIGTTKPGAKLEINLVNPNGWSENKTGIRLTSPDDKYYLDVKAHLIGSGNVGYQLSPISPGQDQKGLIIDSLGNVGIGTDSPGTALHVSGPSDVKISVDGHADKEVGFVLKSEEVNKWEIYRPRSSGDLRFWESGVGDRVTFQAGGNVGIGTSTPSAKLNVDPQGDGGIMIGKSDAGYTSLEIKITAASGGYSSLQAIKSSGTAWGDIVLNPNAGNVGIGITNPGMKLEVNGSIYTHAASANVLSFEKPSALASKLTQKHASLLLYDNGGEDWGGIGITQGLGIWIRTGSMNALATVFIMGGMICMANCPVLSNA